jgi:hypothetical protein
MPQRIALLGLWLVVGFSGCARDAPTAAEPRGVVGLPREELSGLTVALEDVRSRILPALGTGAALDALGSALAELERALAPPEAAAVEDALRRANAAARQVPADTTRLPDKDVMLLVLEHIDAVAHAPAEENRREQ